MLKADLFEELLATYPAEKRELARQIYYRFAEGDSTQFFTQLFVVLGLYAHYVENVPQAVIEANKSAHAGLLKIREEIGLLAQAIDKRNLNITNHAERTDQFCRDAIEACNDASTKIERLVTNIGAQINTQAIVDGIQAQLDKGIRDEIIRPFISHVKELGEQAVPALKEIEKASSKAHTLWMKHIWKTAWSGSLFVTVTLSFLFSIGVYKWFENHAKRKAAEHIANVEAVMSYNQEAFRQLAIAQVPVKVMRTHNGNGMRNPRNFALIVEDAENTEMREVDGHNNGVIFFNSSLSEEMIQGIQTELDKTIEKLKQAAK